MFSLQQDIQTHTTYSDGQNTIVEMIEVAIKTGLKSIIISDHARGWVTKDKDYFDFFQTISEYEKYLDELRQAKLLYKDKIKVLSGLEVEIGIDGEMKLSDGIKEYVARYKPDRFGVDILLGSIHSESFEEDCLKEENTSLVDRRVVLIKNMCNLIRNNKIDVFAHPFQALHGQFSDNLTFEEIKQILSTFKSEWASGHTILFEINGKKYPNYEQWSYNKYEKGEMQTNDLDFLQIQPLLDTSS